MKLVSAPLSIIAAAGLVAGCASSTTGGHGAAADTSTAQSTPSTSSQSASSMPPSVPSGSPMPSSAMPSQAASGVRAPAGFGGIWTGHGRELAIAPDGSLRIEFRTYVTCTATVTTGCDQIIGNEIHDGGMVTGRITQVINSTTVIVTITSSSAPSSLPLGAYRLGHDLGHHALALFSGSWPNAPFCGAGAPEGYCGG